MAKDAPFNSIHTMDIRFGFIDKVDGKAIFPLARIIHSYLQTHPNIGTITIDCDKVEFTKAYFFKVGEVHYSPYGLECKNNVIYISGPRPDEYPHDNLFTFLVNAIHQLKRGYVIKL